MPIYHAYFDKYGVIEDIYKIANDMPIEKLRYGLTGRAIWCHNVKLPNPEETESNVLIFFSFDKVVDFVKSSYVQHKYTNELLAAAGKEV
jgi:hypothetical protein